MNIEDVKPGDREAMFEYLTKKFENLPNTNDTVT